MDRRILVLFFLLGKAAYGDPAAGVEAAFDRMVPQQAGQLALPRLVTANTEAWHLRWWMVGRARRSIDCTYYSFYDDIFGKAFLGLLAKKAREGVKVRLMIDSRGSEDMSRRVWRQGYMQALAATGNAQIKVYNPVTPQLARLFKDPRLAMACNHDKLLIVDGELTVTGGRNIAKGYYAEPEDMPRCWRDTDVLLKGEAVAAGATRAFDEEFERRQTYEIKGAWLFDPDTEAREIDLARRVMERWLDGRGAHTDRGDPILAALSNEIAQYRRLVGYAGYAKDPLAGSHPVPVKVLDRHALIGDKDEIGPNLVALMDAAETEIVIQNPYVVPTKRMVDAWVRAGQRGVAVIIHTNSCKSTDNLLTQAFLIRDWKRLMRDVPTLRVLAYDGPRKLHSKVFVFDRKVAVVGTYNLDALSDVINSEEVAVIKDGDFATRTRLRIEEDMKASIEYRMQVEPTGALKTLVGPEPELEGMAGKLVPILMKLSFMRGIL